MESALDPVFGAVLPVFGLVGCGYLAGRFRIVTQASSAALNQFVYAFALPAMLFVAVYRASLDEIPERRFPACGNRRDRRHRGRGILHFKPVGCSTGAKHDARA